MVMKIIQGERAYERNHSLSATLQKSFGSREAMIRAAPQSEIRTSLNQN